MVFCKACPKCDGDVSVYHDSYGDYLQCFQCGLLRDITASEVRYVKNAPGDVRKLLADQLYYVDARAVGLPYRVSGRGEQMCSG